MSRYTWTPSADYLEHANVTRLMARAGVTDVDALRRWSVEDVARYWDAVVDDLGLPFSTPYTAVLDVSRGFEHPDWFVGGELNLVDACLTRWAADAQTSGRTALVHETEDGTVRRWTFGELDDAVRRAAAGLAALGVGPGDAVALFLPMAPEAVVAFYAAARLGAVLVPLFSGFAPSAIAARVQDAQAKVVVCAQATVRRRKRVEMAAVLGQALPDCPTVTDVVTVGGGTGGASGGPRRTSWADLVAHDPQQGPATAVPSSHTLLLAYTSGTTGRPKGAVHTQAGFLVKTASEVAYSFDVSPGGTFCWVTDMGWIMGPLSVVGTHANGAALLVYEGSPDVPDLNRLWDLASRHRVTMLGVSPTLIRTLRTAAGTDTSRFDLTGVHTLGSTGEPWDEDAYVWLARDVFGGRVPVVNFSGGTEVGGSFLAPYPVEEIAACSLGGPSLGMDVDVVDEQARPVRGTVGELVCRQPWPSMTRGVWRDPERYLEAYWSTFPGLWRHGDHALVDADGQWFVLGRSDDVMNVAGKRLAPAEVEAVLTAHPAVAEAAVVGVPDPTKGEAVWAFWVPRPDAGDDDVSDALRDLVAAELGRPFAPTVVRRVPRLPKTRSQKIMRRAVRAAALGLDPGDLSGAEDPTALDDIRAAAPATA